MKQIIPLLIILTGISSCSTSNNYELTEVIDLKSDIVFPKNYIVTRINEEITIDGIANEPSWHQASFSENFIDIEGIETPKFDTRMKMIWDDTYLYVYSEMKEPHIWANLKQRDTIIFYNNDFEVFLDPSGTGTNYAEIEINAMNTVWDLFLEKAYRVGGKAEDSWNLTELTSAVYIYGTLNNPNDIDSMWTVEIAIPIEPLMQLKGASGNLIQEGEQWRINFSRVEWDFELKNGKYNRKKEGDKYLKENNWVWSNQKVINMHEPEKWGYLQFTKASSTKDIAFIEDPDLEIKQVMFALFRRTKFGDHNYLLELDIGVQKDFSVTYSNEQPVVATFNKTDSGFNYELDSPVTKITYSIDEEGVLKSKR